MSQPDQFNLSANSNIEDTVRDDAGRAHNVAAEATAAIARQLRIATTMGFMTLQAFGKGVNAMYTLGIESLILGVEAMATFRAGMAVVAGPIGAAIVAARAVVSIGAITAMLITIVRLKQGRDQAASETQRWVGVLKYATYLGMVPAVKVIIIIIEVIT